MARTGQTTRLINTQHRGSSVFLRGCLAALVLLPAALVADTADLIGSPAPDFALKSVSGPNLRLSEHRPDVVVLNFWSDWCGKCADAVAALNTLNQQHAADGLRVLTVDVDGKHGEHLAADANLSYPVLLDVKSRVSKSYDLSRLPITVLIDREGTVRFVQKGFKDDAGQQLRAEVAALLNE